MGLGKGYVPKKKNVLFYNLHIACIGPNGLEEELSYGKALRFKNKVKKGFKTSGPTYCSNDFDLSFTIEYDYLNLVINQHQ